MELFTTQVFSPGAIEDGALMEQLLIAPNVGLFAVADLIVAGPEARAALRLALDAVRAHVDRNEDIIARFRGSPNDDLRDRVLEIVTESFTRAAAELFAFARRHPGLALCLDVALLLDTEAFVGHVGDGRVYLIRSGLVHQLTVDHHVQAADPEDTAPLRVLGPRPSVRVESMCMELLPGDRFVIAARSVRRALAEPDLHRVFVSESLPAIAPQLIEHARGRPLVLAGGQLGGIEPSQPDSGRSRLALLAPIPLFAHCSERELRAIASATYPRVFAAGTVLFRRGDPGTELFLVIRGVIRIEQEGKTIVTLGSGSNFGEMAMLDEPIRSADAVAVDDAECLVISRDAFFALLKGNPKLAVKILWNMLLRLSSRLRSTSSRLTELSQVAQMLAPPADETPAQPPERIGKPEGSSSGLG